MSAIRLRIVSDGTEAGTWVEDQDGRIIEGVVSVGWRCSVGRISRAYVTVDQVAVDITAKSQIRDRGELVGRLRGNP